MKGKKIIMVLAIGMATWAAAPAVSTYAATSQSTTSVAVLQKKLAVESPTANTSFLNKSITISGWALDPSGVKAMNIYLNGKLYGQAIYGITRTDVGRSFPSYSGSSNSGYTYTINYGLLSTGTYKITVEMVGKDGKTLKKDVSVTVKKTVLPIKGVVEKPANNITSSGNVVSINGWALDGSGMKQIKVYLDGTYKGDASLGGKRADVAAGFSQYPEAGSSGFSYDLSMQSMSKGNHNIAVEFIGNDGQIIKTERSFVYDGLAPRLSVESPAVNYATDKLSTKVSGWALNAAGIAMMNVYVDGKLDGQATLDLPRGDVGSLFSGYPQGNNSGFGYYIDNKKLAEGNHTVMVETVAMDGTKLYQTKTFKYNKPAPTTAIQSPILNDNINTSVLNISGWSLNVSGVKNITINMDGQPIGEALYGFMKPEAEVLGDKYPDAGESGYNYILDIAALPIGRHDIEIVAEGNDGTISKANTTFYMSGVVEYKYYDNTLDYYVNRQFTQGGNVIVGTSTPPTYDQVKYYMDPNNFINDPTRKYMFLKLTYIEGINVADLNKVLVGKGILEGKGQAFLDAGKKFNVNPIYLIAHSLLETGNGKSTLANGILVKTVDGAAVEPKTTYNVYGVGAKDSDPIRLGSEYAYTKGWFTIEDSIIGGAEFISKNYIQSTLYEQYTLYKMKWNFDVIWHAYATDIGWAYKQTSRIKELVDQMDDPVLIFEVPVFKDGEE